MKSKCAALLVLLLICASAMSGTAPWYRWRNEVNKTLLCAQNPPGNVWVVKDGPYMDSRCRKPGSPQ